MAIYSGFSHKKWWFSIVMLVYQRVISEWWCLASANKRPAKTKNKAVPGIHNAIESFPCTNGDCCEVRVIDEHSWLSLLGCPMMPQNPMNPMVVIPFSPLKYIEITIFWGLLYILGQSHMVHLQDVHEGSKRYQGLAHYSQLIDGSNPPWVP